MPTPVHLWRMETVNPIDEGTPGGNDGTGSNVAVVTGLIGDALDFNGSNSNVNVGDIAELNAVGQFSLLLWMNQDILAITDVIFEKKLNNLNRILVVTDGTPQLAIYLSNGADPQRGAFDYTNFMRAGSYHHLAIVFDGSQPDNASRLKVYVDGEPVVLTFTGTIQSTTAALSTIDAFIGRGSSSFDGQLDDVRMYDVALTEAEVQALAAHLTPVLDSVTNDGDGETVTLTVSNVENPRTVHAFYRVRGSSAAFTESPITRVGPGVLSIGGLEDGTTYEIHVVSSDGIPSYKPSLQSNPKLFTPSLVTAATVIAREDQGGIDLQLDSDCEDLEIVNLDLALVDGTVRVKQALCIALRTFRGEWFLNSEAGVPYYQNILVKNPVISEINSLLKVAILQVANVEKILEFSSTWDTAARELSVSFRVDTRFGPVTVEETL